MEGWAGDGDTERSTAGQQRGEASTEMGGKEELNFKGQKKKRGTEEEF